MNNICANCGHQKMTHDWPMAMRTTKCGVGLCPCPSFTPSEDKSAPQKKEKRVVYPSPEAPNPLIHPELKGQSKAIDEIVREFREGFTNHPLGIFRAEKGKIENPEYFPLTIDNVESFIRTQFPLFAAKEYERGFDDGAAIESEKPDDTLDAIVRDYTSVAYIKVKSELRRRIEDYAAKEIEAAYELGFDAGTLTNKILGKEYNDGWDKGIQAEKLRILKVIDEVMPNILHEFNRELNHTDQYRDAEWIERKFLKQKYTDEIKKVIEATE